MLKLRLRVCRSFRHDASDGSQFADEASQIIEGYDDLSNFPRRVARLDSNQNDGQGSK